MKLFDRLKNFDKKCKDWEVKKREEWIIIEQAYQKKKLSKKSNQELKEEYEKLMKEYPEHPSMEKALDEHLKYNASYGLFGKSIAEIDNVEAKKRAIKELLVIKK